MDTEAFLVERQEICRRLSERRAAVGMLHGDGQSARLFGMEVQDWASLLLSNLPARGIWRWLPRGLMSFAAPLAVGMVRRQFRGASPLGTLLRVLRLIR